MRMFLLEMLEFLSTKVTMESCLPGVHWHVGCQLALLHKPPVAFCALQ